MKSQESPPRRSAMSIILRQLALVLLLACLGLAALVGAGRVDVPYRLNPFAPLDLDAPADWLSAVRLARLKRDGALCRAVLERAEIGHQPLPDRSEPENCPLIDAIALSASASALNDRLTLTCRVAASWILFERQVLQPAAREHLGREVARVEHAGTQVCRRIAGSQRWSQHATANAVDVTGFVLVGGRRISVLHDWNGTGPEAAFLRAVRDGACGVFAAVLGPDYNAAHRDHFHFDHGPFRACR